MLVAFTTDRLRIQRLTLDDAEELAKISDVPEVYQWMAFMEGGFPAAKAKALIAAQDETREFFFAVRLASNPMIGGLGVVDHPDQTIEIGYWLGVDYQKMGYAYEALQGLLRQIARTPSLASRPIIAEARPDNSASIGLLTKAGFRATGRPGPRPNRIEFALG
jgi:RimJ/RimL family protein N-acetyltransferase